MYLINALICFAPVPYTDSILNRLTFIPSTFSISGFCLDKSLSQHRMVTPNPFDIRYLASLYPDQIHLSVS